MKAVLGQRFLMLRKIHVGPFPHGFLFCHDENANFFLYDWDDIAKDKLVKCSCSEAY